MAVYEPANRSVRMQENKFYTFLNHFMKNVLSSK